jgi:PPOX class probable F420-dependent enzyme
MTAEYTDMTEEQIGEFLKSLHNGVLATNRINGPPQSSAVWYLYEDGKIYIASLADTAKYHNIKRDPRVSICVDGGHSDARAVTIYGTAELVEDESAWPDDIMFRIARRYSESDEEARELNDELSDGAVEVLIVVTPTKMFARDYN